MTQEIVPFNDNRNQLLATLPNALPGTMSKVAVIKAVAVAAESVASAVAAASYAIVKVATETSIQIEFLNERRRVIRQDIIPVLATYSAYNGARRAVDGMGLDRDLADAAHDDLHRALERRRDRL